MARPSIDAVRRFYEEGGYVKRKEGVSAKRRRIDQALYGASQWDREGFAGGGVTQRLLRRFVDPPSKWLENWKWRPLPEVDQQLGLTHLPEHIEGYGRFMQDMSGIAGTEGLSPRDLQKAYLTTRMSMQRQAINPEILRDAGLKVPRDQGLVRPESAMSVFLGSPMGERYLRQAGQGEVDPELINKASGMFRNFGKVEDARDMFGWAPNLAGMEGRTSELVDRAAKGQGSPQEWSDLMAGVRGISPAKHGFYGSLLGYGDMPTLDARQIQLWTGQPTSASVPWTAKPYKASEGVERLAARQRALGLDMPEGLDPFYQHLTHHALWDTFGNDRTTHQELIDSMLGRARGGRVAMSTGGDLLARIMGKPKASRLLRSYATRTPQEYNLLDTYARMTGKSPDEILNALRSKQAGVRDDTETMRGISSLMGTKPFEDSTASIMFPDMTRPTVGPESLQGGYLVGNLSDRSSAGPIVDAIGGTKLKQPLVMPGGSDFPRFHDELWAGAKGPMQGLVNAIEGAGIPENAPVYFTNKLMGYQALDQTHMAMQAAADALRGAPLSRGEQGAFNKYIREVKESAPGGKYLQPLPDFPGIESPNLDEYLSEQSMAKRSALMRGMDIAKWQKEGIPIPSAAGIRLALTDPHLLTAREGSVGRTIGSIDRGQPLEMSPEVPHGSYPVGLRGDYLGGFDRPVPAEMAFPDFFAGKGPMNPRLMRSFMLSNPVQAIDQQYLDRFMPQFEKLQRGWQEGGRVGMAGGGSTLKEAIMRVLGQYGSGQARRLSNVADAKINLAPYSEDALVNAFKDPTSSYVGLKPSTFQNYTYKLNPDELAYSDLKTGRPMYGAEFAPKSGATTHDDYIKFLQGIAEQGKLRDVPFLNIDMSGNIPRLPFVSGHSGRHRMEALAGMGDDPALTVLNRDYSMPDPVNRVLLRPRGYVLPEDANRNFINNRADWNALAVPFPQQRFAEGGGVRAFPVQSRRRDYELYHTSQFQDDWS